MESFADSFAYFMAKLSRKKANIGYFWIIWQFSRSFSLLLTKVNHPKWTLNLYHETEHDYIWLCFLFYTKPHRMYKMCEKNGKNGFLMRKKNFVYYLVGFLRRYKQNPQNRSLCSFARKHCLINWKPFGRDSDMMIWFSTCRVLKNSGSLTQL